MTKPFTPRDYLARRARREGYLARSAYKLQEIIGKFNLIAPGQTVLDLGSSPGSWLQVASEAVKPGGRVLGVDKDPIKFQADNVSTLRQDVFDPTLGRNLKPYCPFDVILSDLAPATSGIRAQDQARSLELARQAADIARVVLKKRGQLAIKIFQSPATAKLVRDLKTLFRTVHVYKPRASRDRSFEVYIIALNKID